MKKIAFAAVFCCAVCCLRAQLTGTRWVAKINAGEIMNVIFEFNKDTCSIYTVADSITVETMAYTIKDSSITLYKISGQSDCETTTPGIYTFGIKDKALVLHMVKDDCDDRSSTIENLRWSPWVIPAEVMVDEAILKQYVGTYQHEIGHPLYVTYSDGRLWIEGPNNKLPRVPMITESPTRFFVRIAGVHMDFVKDAVGKVVKAVSHEEEDIELQKIK